MSLIENLIPRRRGRPSKAVADANAAVEKLNADLTRLNSKRDELTTRQADAQANAQLLRTLGVPPSPLTLAPTLNR